MNTVQEIYDKLYACYGPQGWWPYIKSGYHPLDYGFEKSEEEIFEISLGVILTQNLRTAPWRSRIKEVEIYVS